MHGQNKIYLLSDICKMVFNVSDNYAAYFLCLRYFLAVIFYTFIFFSSLYTMVFDLKCLNLNLKSYQKLQQTTFSNCVALSRNKIWLVFYVNHLPAG